MALTSITADLFKGPIWRSLYKSLKSDSGPTMSKSRGQLKSSVGAGAQYHIDTALLVQFDLAASGTSTIDLNSYTDIAGTASQAMVKLKGLCAWLFDTDDDDDVTANPTGITLGGAAATQHPLFLSDAASDKYKLLAGDVLCHWTPTAAGVTVSSSVKHTLLTNLDSSNRALGRILFLGCTA